MDLPAERVGPFSLLNRCGPLLLAVTLGCTALIIRLISPGVLEISDGVYHYLYARHSWQHPELLLDHWAKPVYTLLGSPFAQLGHWGMALFNALLSVLAMLCAASITGRQHVGFRWAAPIVLMLAPAWFAMVMAGMTEILFGTLGIMIVWLLFKERWRTAAVVASFLPFTRPEFVAVMPFIALWIGWKRQWRALPLLLTGSVVYALIGWPVFGDPLWIIHNDPYVGNAIYGKGGFWHYWDHIDEALGGPLRKLFLSACALSPVLFFTDKTRREEHLRAIVLLGLPAIAIWAVHSYVWWKGGIGSLGLIRVLATVVPFAAGFAMYVFGAAWRRWMPQARWTPFALAILVLLLGTRSLRDLRYHVEMPVKAEPQQVVLDRASERIKTLRAPGQRLVYLFPYLGAKVGVDPWDPADARALYFLDWDREDWGLRPGDLLAWDAQLCPNEGTLPLGRLMKDPGFKLEHVEVADVDAGTFEDRQFDCWIFRKAPGKRTAVVDTLDIIRVIQEGSMPGRVERQPCSDGDTARTCLSNGEYPVTADAFPSDPPGVMVSEWRIDVQIDVDPAEGEKVFLVFAEEAGGTPVRYIQAPLVEGRATLVFAVPSRPLPVNGKLYLWNRGAKGIVLRSMTAIGTRWSQRSEP